MNSHDLHYIFFIMAIKMICQSGAQFSIFSSHLPFPNHFQNFKLITLTSLLETFPLPYTFIKFKLFIYFIVVLSLSYTGSIYITSFKFLPFFCSFLSSRNFYFFPLFFLIPGSENYLFTRDDRTEVASTFLGRLKFSKLIFPVI